MAKQDSPFISVLNSINKTKKNIIEEREIAEKDYPLFVVARMLAHNADCVLFVNDVNFSSPGMTNKRHYEYLLHSITKKNRYAKYVKPPNSEYHEFIQHMLNCSREVAEGYLEILTEKQINEIEQLRKSWLENST